MKRISLAAQVITAIAAIAIVTMLFMLLRSTQREQQVGSDAVYFHECYQAFISEFPLTKYKGSMDDYLSEARKACP